MAGDECALHCTSHSGKLRRELHVGQPRLRTVGFQGFHPPATVATSAGVYTRVETRREAACCDGRTNNAAAPDGVSTAKRAPRAAAPARDGVGAGRGASTTARVALLRACCGCGAMHPCTMESWAMVCLSETAGDAMPSRQCVQAGDACWRAWCLSSLHSPGARCRLHPPLAAIGDGPHAAQ